MQSNLSAAPEGLGLQSWFHQELYELDKTKSEVEQEAQRLPANPIEWIETPGFLHSAEDLPPAGEYFLYPKSYEIIRDIFDLLCPYCNEDMPAIRRGEVPREEQILRRFGECPKCGITQVDMLRARKACFYQQVAMAVGMRAGKSYLAANVASWIVQQALLLPNVRRSFGLSPGPPIEIAFAASTEMQTKDTIWAAFRSIYENSPWFQRYVTNLRQREETSGRDLYRETDNRLEFKEIGLTLVSLNSSSGSAAGRTRLGVFLDELARFRDTAGPNSADEVYRTLQRSMRTLWAKSDRMLRIGIHPPVHPLLVAISSPMHEEDRIMRLVRDAREYPGLRIYAQHLPSWEMNPDFTIEDFEEELAADPIGVRRDFGAEPMGINERLFKNPEILTAQIVPERRPILMYQTQNFEEAGFSYVAPALGSCWTDLVRRRFMHCDPGRKEDSFGISIVSVEGFPPDYTVYIDAVIEVRPEPAPKGSRMKSREVHFEQVLKFMLQLRRHLNIVKVSFDHWQQVHYVQKLRAMGFNIEEHNIEMEDYLRFASDVEAGRVKFFPPERAHYDRKLRDVPMTKALHELKMLERVSPKRVDHPEGGSSDIAICMVGAHRNATQSFFADGYVRGRPQMPLNRGYHISQMAGLNGNQRVGGIVRFRR